MSPVPASRVALALAILSLVSACGGGVSTPLPVPRATGLAYTDPATYGWRLVKDASTSTPTHLVLSLVGPTGEKGRGVAFNLRQDGTVKFGKFANGSYIKDLGVFQLGNQRGVLSVVDGEPVTKDVGALVGGVKEGGRVLSVGAFQKDRRWPAQDLAQPLYQIAIDFDPAQTPVPVSGTVVPLTFLKARAIPADVGDDPNDPKANPASWVFEYKIDDVRVAVGALTAQ